MNPRTIPATDIAISPLALGGWLTLGGSLDDAESMRLLRFAVEQGVNFLDLADVYAGGGAERVVGKFLRDSRRTDLVVSSKVFWPTSDDPADRGLSRRHVHTSIDRTLQRLGLDHLDLYFCHREDPATPLAETVQAMGDLVAAGKVRAWGTSCWRASVLKQAHRLAADLGVAPPRVEQPQYNLLTRHIERDIVPACRALDMGIVAFSPLASGALTGKYLDGKPAGSRGSTTSLVDAYLTPACMQAVREFVAMCRLRGVTPSAVALAWLIQRPGITAVIMGATNEDQIRSNLQAANLNLDGELLQGLDEVFPPPKRSRLRDLVRRLMGRS